MSEEEGGEEASSGVRARVGLVLGPLAGLALAFAPIPGLPEKAHLLAGVLAFTLVWWVTEPIPIPATALLAPTLCVFLGIAEPRAIYAPFADPILFIFIGSFMLAEAMRIHGLERRVALAILSRGLLSTSPRAVLAGVGLAAAAISMWISNSAATALLLPVVLGLVRQVREARSGGGGTDPAPAFLLMLTYAASVGGLGTPIGTPPNLIGIGTIERLAGVRISFFEWMAVGLPIAAVSVVLVHLQLSRRYRGALGGTLPPSFRSSLADRIQALGPLSPGEKSVLAALGAAFVLWTAPAAVALVAGPDSAAAKLSASRIPEGAVGALLVALLTLLPAGGRRTLTWREASRIDWGTVLLFGGGLALGALMFQTGLAKAIGDDLAGWIPAGSPWLLTLVAIYLAIAMSEATSNTATASALVPIVIAVAQASGVNPIAPAVATTLAASFGFLLPVSTGPNAIVFGTGLLPLRTMLGAGWLFDLAGGLVVFGVVRLVAPWLGWA